MDYARGIDLELTPEAKEVVAEAGLCRWLVEFFSDSFAVSASRSRIPRRCAVV